MAWEIVGHEHVLALLEAALDTDRLPRSLLLTGPRGVGKRSVALALARAINCRAESRPCGTCRACRLSASSSFPDVHLIELREGRQKISIQDVRQLQTELSRRPVEGQRRVAVIVYAERFSAEAENCLLKTLEEPPPDVSIILTAEEADALLPTTVSRCQRIRLRPVPTSSIQSHLRDKLGLAKELAGLLAGLAEGRPGWAIAASRAGRLDDYRAAIARLERIVPGGKLARLEAARTLAEGWSTKSEAVREELRVWAGWWHDLLRSKLGLEKAAGSADDRPDFASVFSIDDIRQALAALLQARADLDQNAHPRLALEVALLRLPRLPHRRPLPRQAGGGE